MRMFSSLIIFSVLCLPVLEAFYVKTTGEGLTVYSSLQDGFSGNNSSIPYPAGARLTLTCLSDHEVFWADSNHNLAQFHQSVEKSRHHFSRNLTIPELTAEHDNLKLKCFEHQSINSVEVKLDVLSPPRLSINFLPEENSIECNVTENWKPELQLCIRTAGDWNCKNESHVAISFGPEEEKVKCRAMLKKDYPSLKNETKEQFKKMFDDTQVVFDVNRGLAPIVTSSLQDGPVEESASVPYPAGAKLTLSCQSRGEVFWADENNSLDAFEQFTSAVNGQHVRNLTIPELTADHDNLYLKCFEHQSSDSVHFKLNILSPPKLSIGLSDPNYVECKVTENWKPELELCISTAGDWECLNNSRRVVASWSVEERRKAACRARLPKFASLNDKAMKGFQKMFDETQVTIDINSGQYLPPDAHTMTPALTFSSSVPTSSISTTVIAMLITCVVVVLLLVLCFITRFPNKIRKCFDKLKIPSDLHVLIPNPPAG